VLALSFSWSISWVREAHFARMALCWRVPELMPAFEHAREEMEPIPLLIMLEDYIFRWYGFSDCLFLMRSCRLFLPHFTWFEFKSFLLSCFRHQYINGTRHLFCCKQRLMWIDGRYLFVIFHCWKNMPNYFQNTKRLKFSHNARSLVLFNYSVLCSKSY